MEQYFFFFFQCQLKIYSINPAQSHIAILFLHGGPGSGAMALMGLPAFQLLSQNFHCLYFDQRGCGDSTYDLKKGLSIEQITSDVLHVIQDSLQRFHIQKFYLWGGSFGGYLACLCLEKFHNELSGIILSSPAITFHRQQALSFYQAMQSQYNQRLGENHFLQSISLSPEDFFKQDDVREFIFSVNNPSHSLQHICAMSDWFFQHHFHNFFTHLSLPLLIMQGQDDPICQYQYIDNEVSHLKNREYHLYENCGHEIFCDCKEDFVKTITEFIRRNEQC